MTGSNPRGILLKGNWPEKVTYIAREGLHILPEKGYIYCPK